MNRSLRAAAMVSLLGGLVLPLAAACGQPGSLPDPAPCPTPAAIPTATSTRTLSAEGTYRGAIVRGAGRLNELDRAWIQRRPSRKISNSASFRSDYAAYADEAVCLATALRDLPIPDPKYAQWDALFDEKMDQAIAIMQQGRTAVDRRNTSDYKDWNAAVDARGLDLERLMQVFPPR
ncbi:MAG: hypothetical protein HY875_10680 [Chloroflexi bacterium]|nr:hypothetical protein [Chloroflexota bacterium]